MKVEISFNMDTKMYERQVVALKILLEAGANVTVDDNYAIGYALKNGHTEIAKMLIEAGADVTVDDIYAHQITDDIELLKLLVNSIK